ncbi:hypothetical protein [Nonomuraea jabiensis]|uniref:Uncharacterized protein n=1 Tax=Nonomuraea jabiensis TaxID=882448 RepID=A0A7W9L7J0_9ACTN|nr:hypothetical protein [Nonomuraea jabiensis]MBB5773532.1 hypothetical protein [Nonomuraea jabiensis]
MREIVASRYDIEPINFGCEPEHTDPPEGRLSRACDAHLITQPRPALGERLQRRTGSGRTPARSPGRPSGHLPLRLRVAHLLVRRRDLPGRLPQIRNGHRPAVQLIFPNAVNDAPYNRSESFNRGAAFFTGSSRPRDHPDRPGRLGPFHGQVNPGSSVLLFVRNTRSPIFGSISLSRPCRANVSFWPDETPRIGCRGEEA